MKKNLLDEKELFVIALQHGPLAGNLFHKLAAFIREEFPNVSATYLLTFDTGEPELHYDFNGSYSVKVLRGAYLFDLIIIVDGQPLMVHLRATSLLDSDELYFEVITTLYPPEEVKTP